MRRTGFRRRGRRSGPLRAQIGGGIPRQNCRLRRSDQPPLSATADAVARRPSRMAVAPLAPILTTTVSTLLREPRNRGFHIVSPRHLHRFALVRQQDVHVRQDLSRRQLPAVVGIVVGVERGGQAGGFHPPKKFGHSRQQFALQEQRRHVEVPRRCQVIQVEIFKAQLGDCARDK